MLPSSQVIGLASCGWAAEGSWWRGPPHTSASKAPSPPVRWTCVTNGSATAACARAVPPTTISNIPAAISGPRPSRSTGSNSAWRGCSLSRTARPYSKIWQIASPAAKPVTFPAPSTSATPPDSGRDSSSRAHSRANPVISPGFAQRTVPRKPRKIAQSWRLVEAAAGKTSTSTWGGNPPCTRSPCRAGWPGRGRAERRGRP